MRLLSLQMLVLTIGACGMAHDVSRIYFRPTVSSAPNRFQQLVTTSAVRRAVEEESAKQAAVAGQAAIQAASEAFEARGRFLNAIGREQWAATRPPAFRLSTRYGNNAAIKAPLPSAAASVGSVGASALISHHMVCAVASKKPSPAYAVSSRSQHRSRSARVRMFATSCLEWLIGLDYDREEDTPTMMHTEQAAAEVKAQVKTAQATAQVMEQVTKQAAARATAQASEALLKAGVEEAARRRAAEAVKAQARARALKAKEAEQEAAQQVEEAMKEIRAAKLRRRCSKIGAADAKDVDVRGGGR